MLQREGKTEKEGKVKEEKNNTFISKKSFTFFHLTPDLLPGQSTKALPLDPTGGRNPPDFLTSRSP